MIRQNIVLREAARSRLQTKIRDHFDLIEQHRADLTAFVTALDDTRVSWKPNAGTWSIRQIIEHLVLSDENVGRAQDVASIPLEPLLLRLMPRAWRLALVLSALNRDLPLPLPSPDIVPTSAAVLPDLLTRWQVARSAMRDALDPLRGDETPYFHPILGRLTGVQMLTLSATHTAYHTRQMETLQTNPAFPRASVGSAL